MAAQSLWLWRLGLDHVLKVDIDGSFTVDSLAVQLSITAVVWLSGLGLGLASAEDVDTRVALRSVAFVCVTVLFGTVSLALLGRVLLG